MLGCRVGAPKWIEQLASGFCAIEIGGRSYRITQPNLHFSSGRGESPVCLIHDRHGYIFLRLHCEEGGRLTRMLFAHGGKAEIHPPFTEDCLKRPMQWWFQDADGARRCLATGLVLLNVCIVDSEHGSDQLDAIDREHTRTHTAGRRFHDVRAIMKCESSEPFQPSHVWVERIILRQATRQFGSAGMKCATTGMLGDKINYTSAEG